MVNKLNQLKNKLLNIRKDREIITTHELGDYILKTSCIPTPAYSKSQEYGYIVNPRTIYVKKNIKRRPVGLK